MIYLWSDSIVAATIVNRPNACRCGLSVERSNSIVQDAPLDIEDPVPLPLGGRIVAVVFAFDPERSANTELSSVLPRCKLDDHRGERPAVRVGIHELQVGAHVRRRHRLEARCSLADQTFEVLWMVSPFWVEPAQRADSILDGDAPQRAGCGLARGSHLFRRG